LYADLENDVYAPPPISYPVEEGVPHTIDMQPQEAHYDTSSTYNTADNMNISSHSEYANTTYSSEKYFFPGSKTKQSKSGFELAMIRYTESIQKGEKVFLPSSCRQNMIQKGYLKKDNKSWDVERSAYKRYMTEVLYKDQSEERINKALKEMGFKIKSKHKKSKNNTQSMQTKKAATTPSTYNVDSIPEMPDFSNDKGRNNFLNSLDYATRKKFFDMAHAMKEKDSTMLLRDIYPQVYQELGFHSAS